MTLEIYPTIQYEDAYACIGTTLNPSKQAKEDKTWETQNPAEKGLN